MKLIEEDLEEVTRQVWNGINYKMWHFIDDFISSDLDNDIGLNVRDVVELQIWHTLRNSIANNQQMWGGQ
jgi:hypothetical protein